LYNEYFNDFDVREEFNKEFICIFDGWLGKENYHKLDEVTEKEWFKFDTLVTSVCEKYEVYLVDLSQRTAVRVTDVNTILCTFEQSGEKGSSDFMRLIIPELGAVLTEDWDYTYILWHRNKGAVEALKGLVDQAGLYHFHN